MWFLYIHFDVFVNSPYQDELINCLFYDTLFPKVSETTQRVSVADWLLLINTGLKLQPQVNSIAFFLKTVQDEIIQSIL